MIPEQPVQASIKFYHGFYAVGKPAGALITCPKCTHTINCHFRKDVKPCWEFDGDNKDNNNKPTIIPEIKCGDCKAKFMVDDGLIEYC